MAKPLKKLVIWFFKLLLGVALLLELMVLPLRWFDPPMWSWRLHRAWFSPESYPTQVEQHWQSLNQMSPYLLLAVVAAEDQRFPRHWGIDMPALWQAYQNNQQGGRLRGGSTISQQTAKNLWLWPLQSYWRKGVEALLSLALELNLPKSRIIELYLNIVEFGPGIYGAEAASRHYFRVSAESLSAHQAASLAALLPSPYRYRLSPKSAYIEQRIQWIERQMRQLGLGYVQFGS